MKLVICTLVLVISQAHALSIHEAARQLNGMVDPSKAMQNEDLFQGDIAGIDPTDRNAITSKKKLWTNGVVYYQISSELNKIRPLIQQAMAQYQRRTNGCIRFVESTGSGNYIQIFRHNGCYSYIGMTGGRQPLSLGYGCWYVGTIVHELGHALGLHHEQNRSDRDGYLKIHEENVSPSQRYNFQKLRPDQNLLMTPFDYNYIMEYGTKAFSMNGRPTIEVLQPGALIQEPYDKQGLDDKDSFIINSLYSSWEKVHETVIRPVLLKLRPEQNFLMTPFDYNSIMEYGTKAFSMNGKPTIEVLQPGAHIQEPYDKQGLDDKDSFTINSLYSCPGYTRPPPEKRPDVVCNFEKDMCMFSAEQRTTSPVIYQEAGTSNHYLRADRQAFYRIITPGLSVNSDVVCISFKYRIDGRLSRDASIHLFGRGYAQTRGINKEDTHGWKSVQYEMKPPGDFRIFFDIYPSHGSSFGLDDFVYGQHPCKK